MGVLQPWKPLAAVAAALAAALAAGCGGSFGTVSDAPVPAAAESPAATVVLAGSGNAELTKIDLGRRLFFDEELSRPAGFSCGTCHDPFLGWGDGRPQGKGVQDHTLAGDTDGDGVADHDTTLAVAGNLHKTVLTRRNSPTIYNAWIYSSLFWDGRAGGLAHQALFPIEGADEMNSSWAEHVVPLLEADEEYVRLFHAAFGDPRVTPHRAAQAIGAYEETISVFDTPWDRWEAGDLTALTPEEELGKDLFFGKAGCRQCHPGPLLTSMEFVNTGVPSAGTFALEGQVDFGHGKRLDLTVDPPVAVDDPAGYCQFKVPQLRMVGVTAPYMHNGAFATLEEVVEFYDQGGGPDLCGSGNKSPLLQPLGLTPEEKAALVAFLRNGLTGEEIR